jgi:thiol-disulfide isomerase/thioredoxin
LSIYNRLTNFLKNTFQDRFKRYLIISLIILGMVIGFTSQGTAGTGDVNFFYLPGCPHCEEQRPFNEKLAKEFPSIQIVEHNAAEEQALLSKMLEDLGIEDEPGFPITIITISENQVLISGWVSGGWVSEETTGKAIEEALQKCLEGNCPQSPGAKPGNTIVLPFIGEIALSDYSLPALAVILGIVDGFNPCAMWVLVYLISLVATLRDRKRIWLICGSFVLASGVLYFLFMTAWLNAFLLIGYVKAVTIVIGLVALGGGILQVREVIKTKGAVVCEVTDEESRKKTMTRIQKIVSSPLTFGILVGIIALAFAVNSVEFLCSAAIPAVFTQVLSLAGLSTVQYYGYILLYVLFFMLDDTIIFGTAAFALTSRLGDRYAKYSRPVGATILIILGLLLLACLYSSRFDFLKPICSILQLG